MVENRGSQSGFTLVELAIVMIIIGLLIGGILKGQEMITNAQVAATITRIKNIDVAANTFRDSYAALPGDMRNAQMRLACSGGSICTGAGTLLPNGNGRIDQNINAPLASDERLAFWAQLSAAELFSAVDNEIGASTAATDYDFSQTHPSADVGGGFIMGYSTGAVGGTNLIAASLRGLPGHYLALTNTANLPVSDTTGIIRADVAERIDRKIDDGNPNSGAVLAYGTTPGAAPACVSAADRTGVYNASGGGAGCGLYFRIQQ